MADGRFYRRVTTRRLKQRRATDLDTAFRVTVKLRVSVIVARLSCNRMADKESNPPDSTARRNRVARLFAEFLAAVGGNDGLDFEQWVQQHRDVESELRALHDDWRKLDKALREGPTEPAGRLDPAREQRDSPRPALGLREGTVVGDFRLTSRMGQGGMGEVWEAEQLSLRRRVAMKFIRPDRASAEYLDFFHREARAGGRLSHPGIVAVYGHGRSNGLDWIAMELVEGSRTLRDVIGVLSVESLPLDHDRHTATLIATIADAVQAAHDAKVIHRDLKPGNILITSDGRPKVTDFGLARITDETAISQTGEVAGSYYYMSPEQVAAKRTGIDHRTDLFSLGVVMYEMLALRRPFEGDTSHQIAQQILTADPQELRSLRSRIPRDLVVICEKALEKDRNHRYPTAAALADDLRRFLRKEPIWAQPPTGLERLIKWTRRNPAKSVAVSVTGVALTVILLLLASLAQTNEVLADARDRADKQAKEAQENLEDVLRLSALQDLEDLLAEADALWPPYPKNIKPYREWVLKANELVAQLPSYRTKRQALRALALPRSEEQRQVERTSHPAFGEFSDLSGELESTRQSLLHRRDGVVAALPEVDWRKYPADASGLNKIAWRLVDPKRSERGQESLGLLLALRATELADNDSAQKAMVSDTLAWAYFALGQDEEAFHASVAALAAAPAQRRAEFEGYLAKIEEEIAAASSGLGAAEQEIAELEDKLAALDDLVDERQDWRFSEAHEEARWWNAQLTKLIRGLEALSERETGLLTATAVSPEHGWSIARRLTFAETMEAGFEPGGEFARCWEEAMPAIAETYPELALSPQMGLVPLGADPASGLWEFAHLMTGEPAERGKDRKLILTEETGVVLVLLRGGSFWMGAQAGDPNSRNYDPLAKRDEGPVHKVDLSCFFISKHELTQGQWERLSGRTPSRYALIRGPWREDWLSSHTPVSLLHPVEQVSWQDCMTWLSRAGLSLPSEAQWEYGARGGTDSPWWTGAEKETLAGAANLLDSYAKHHGMSSGWTGYELWLNDGATFHAPIGTYSANAFGLHDVVGNMYEWCLDAYDRRFYGQSPQLDPVSEGTVTRVRRGGSYNAIVDVSRSATRTDLPPSHASLTVGVRPARTIDP